WGRMGIDATTKIPPETEHEWGATLESDGDVAAMVDRRWAEYGLGDLDLKDVDPNLFGYDM
ncbi:MAG: UbiD family decarboxylase, partial [Moorea sp. SIO2C4]|nr:UbiD family decarboxylase [Moorena sp. SIO2C4]